MILHALEVGGEGGLQLGRSNSDSMRESVSLLRACALRFFCWFRRELSMWGRLRYNCSKPFSSHMSRDVLLLLTHDGRNKLISEYSAREANSV